MRAFANLFLIPALVTGYAPPALAAWPNSPFTNRAVSTAASQQQLPTSVSDGAGGAIVTWQDQRSGSFDIYAQHVLASGAVDPAWPANGRALCTAANNQQNQTIVSDGAGGAIVTWQDNRLGFSALLIDIYAQHVLASGAVDPAWPTNGRALCTAAINQNNPTIVSDGAGGGIVTWQDTRVGNIDIYAQHVLATGAVDPAWPADGRALCTAALSQQNPTIASDGAGGAIVSWMDYRFAQLISDIFAQHVLASGAVDGTWPVDGRGLCTAANNQTLPVIVSDGVGGAIVTWNDLRTGTSDIYAQHVLASGSVDGAWPGDGRGLCTAVGHQVAPAVVSDGAGGAIVAWHDLRGASYDIYAHHVLASGALDAWPADGRAVSTPSGEQSFATIVSDGAGGVLVTWQDLRSGTFDIYAQRVARHGYLGTPEAEIVSVTDVPSDQGGKVKLSWNASYLESDPYNLVSSYRVYRSVPPGFAVAMKAAGASFVSVEDEEQSLAQPGELLTTFAAGTTYYWEYLATVTADFLPNYSYLAPTAQDSTPAGAPTTAFMLQARTAGTQHWESLPMAGYSVDNLAPGAPEALTGQYSAGSTALHWDPNTEADLAGYRLYRGASASFVPGPGNLIATLPDTGHVDAFATPSYYKLTAFDSHGNESPVAMLAPPGTVDVEVSAPVLAFSAPAPNPAVTRTTLQYSLPGAGTVRLSMYDAAGRLMRELASGAREAGPHVETWDLRDASGRVVGAGLYFARLETDGGTLVRRVAVRR